MAFVQARTPFAVLDDSRLHALTSVKNRQNNILTQNASLKAPSSAPAKRRLASELLFDEFDSENVNPDILLSPSKRAKNIHGTPVKVSKFAISDTVLKTAPISSLNPSMKRKALSVSVPTTTTSTPTITNLRGSPKNRRISQLSSKRRSMTPYRRFDPPAKAAALPFSIDAALSGTISSYTSPPVMTSTPEFGPPAPILSKKSSKSMPNNWFFDIHEDTPEEEATNLMEHSASTLDISSDDDSTTARAKDALERGKENVPPPEWTGPVRHTRSVQRTAHKGIGCPKKAAKYAAMGGPDAMLEDRIALREMDVSAFVSELEDENVEVPISEDVENQPQEKVVEQIAPIPTPLIQEKEPIVICEDAPEVAPDATTEIAPLQPST